MSDEKRPDEGKEIQDKDLDKVSGGTGPNKAGHVQEEGHGIDHLGHRVDPAGREK